MDIGIGLPNSVPGTDGQTLVGWAARAEQAGFTTLGTIGRLVYDSYEELVALAAAAAVTSRIRLTTSVLLAPLRPNAALLAKQAASLDRISGGRLTLGLGIGGREDDFRVSGVAMADRGRRLDQQLTVMRRVWAGQERGDGNVVGPRPARGDGPELILGGGAAESFRRMARFSDGWMLGGGTPEMFAQGAAAADRAWQDAGRPGRPRKLALAYFALGAGARERASSYLGHYYAFLGSFADRIAAGAAVTPEAVRDAIDGFSQAGCDELIFVPTVAQLDQVEQLAAVASS